MQRRRSASPSLGWWINQGRGENALTESTVNKAHDNLYLYLYLFRYKIKDQSKYFVISLPMLLKSPDVRSAVTAVRISADRQGRTRSKLLNSITITMCADLL